MISVSTPVTWLAGTSRHSPRRSMKTARSIWRPLQGFASARSMPASAPFLVSETGGEASTLTPAEQESIIRTAVEVAHGRVRVIAGAG